MKGKVIMPLAELVKEHKRLIRVLKSDRKPLRLREAKKQAIELKTLL